MFASKIGARVFIVLGLLIFGSIAFAQTSSDIQDHKAQLQAQLDQIDKEIATLQNNLQNAQKEQNSLQRDLQILDDQIQTSKLSIQRRNLAIQQLSQNIQDKEDTITGLNDKLLSENESLASIIRETNQLDKTSFVIAALSSHDISDFFADLDQFSNIQKQMQNSFVQIRTDTAENEKEKADLEDQLAEETQLRQVQQLQQQQLQAQENEKNRILSITKGQEQAYGKLIVDKQQSAAQIRAALFELTGTKAIPFEVALQYAQLAQAQTGIRPAFLLGIITEESNLGENVGTGSWTVDMNPTRDRPVFAAITNSLGLSPDAMPVSKKPWYGWGGAMGPAQFIPSTWALYAGYTAPNYTYNPSKDRIGKLTGNKPPNPWDPKDAFMAAALYLTDSGAGTQTRSAEFKAAMCYLAGCGQVNNKSLQFYGNDVLALADKYQNEIDILSGN